jgi:S1-C subfamily serine protease
MLNKIKSLKIKNFLVVLAIIISVSLNIFVAKAGLLNDFLQNILNPFNQKNASSTVEQKTQENTSLYKPVVDYENAVIEAVAKVSPAVVSITISKNVPIIEQCPYNPFGNLPPDIQKFFGDNFFQFYAPCQKGEKMQEVGYGSGFVVSEDGLILTNKHVVLDEKASYTVLTNDGKKYDAKVLARDPLLDLAILKINANNLKTVKLGDSNSLKLGQTAITIGNALGEFRNTVSVGVISGLARTIVAGGPGFEETISNLIQTDAAINPGNSGGPLINLRGEVVGINTAMAQNAENIGFAIPINFAKKDIESIKKSGKIERPFLGIRYIIVDENLAKEKNLSVNYGALVESDGKNPAVIPDSPADLAGIQPKDIILEINGEKITKDNPLSEIILKYSPNNEVDLKILRGKKEINLKLKLGSFPEKEI